MKADKKMRKKKKFNLKKYCEPPPILNQWQCLVLRQHRERLRNAEPIVDTKPPILNRFMYYKPKVLLEKERNLQIIMAENKELLKRINIINRTTVSFTSFQTALNAEIKFNSNLVIKEFQCV
ncbi:hypothetical protein C0J52_16315 [Blattella germanica]|nr:hypothetical protein C0J52_16315 [Blattella germanica]